MVLANEDAEKQKAKEEEKASKGKTKDPIGKIESTIEKVIPDQQRKDNVIQSLQKMEASFNEFENNILERYPTDNSILINKNSNHSELINIFTDVSELRKAAFDSVVDFHFNILDQTEEKKWNKIMKEVNKRIQ